jgi:hypothetical protein
MSNPQTQERLLCAVARLQFPDFDPRSDQAPPDTQEDPCTRS